MKGISPLIAAVLVIAISISAIAVALNIGNPSIERSKEILILDEGKSNLRLIDSSINQVLQEGDGSSRKITLKVTSGTYRIYDNMIEFEMQTNQQIVGSGVVVEEDILSITASTNKITASVSYNFNFIGEKRFGQGTHMLIISNSGGDIEIS